MGSTVAVGMSEVKVSARAGDTLVALGLGSCIGVCLYDRRAKVAAMVHVMLPESNGRGQSPGKFADTGVPLLVETIEKAGGSKKDCLCAIGGGAEVFSFSSSTPGLAIGKRNGEAVKAALKTAGLRIMAEDLGGNVGRTVSLDVATGVVKVRPVGGQERELAKLG
ncbi:MAG: chemotaxis protein CheD [Armatimonadia bacterium]|nr:chemotaxis protein CheD [Armatimonadia bacterium]